MRSPDDPGQPIELLQCRSMGSSPTKISTPLAGITASLPGWPSTSSKGHKRRSVEARPYGYARHTELDHQGLDLPSIASCGGPTLIDSAPDGEARDRYGSPACPSRPGRDAAIGTPSGAALLP